MDHNSRKKYLVNLLLYALLLAASIFFTPFLVISFGQIIAISALSLIGLLFVYNLFKYISAFKVSINIPNPKITDDFVSKNSVFELATLKDSFSYVFDNLGFFAKTMPVLIAMVLCQISIELARNLENIGVLALPIYIIPAVLVLFLSISLALSWFKFYLLSNENIVYPWHALKNEKLFITKVSIFIPITLIVTIVAIFNPVFLYSIHHKQERPSIVEEVMLEKGFDVKSLGNPP